MTKLQYRGVSYSNDNREQTSNQAVDHSYRGQHYSAPCAMKLHLWIPKLNCNTAAMCINTARPRQQTKLKMPD
ncbi:DUF4278 domain-containing protein [Synechococcus lacustris Tous-12m]